MAVREHMVVTDNECSRYYRHFSAETLVGNLVYAFVLRLPNRETAYKASSPQLSKLCREIPNLLLKNFQRPFHEKKGRFNTYCFLNAAISSRETVV